MAIPTARLKLARQVLGGLTLWVILACGGGGVPTELSFSAVPVTFTLQKGKSTDVDLTIFSRLDTNATVAFKATGLPTGVTAAFTPVVVPAGSSSSKLKVTAAANAPDFKGKVDVTGTESTGAKAQVSLNVTVQSQATDFTVDVSPTLIIDFRDGDVRTVGFSVRGNGYTGTVDLSLSTPSDDFFPENLSSSSVSLATGTATGTFDIRCDVHGAVEQGLLVTLTGTAQGVTKTDTVYCRVFGLSPRKR